MTWVWWTLLALAWVAVGMLTVVLVLRRRGHPDPVWFLLGVVLGPILIPLALERTSARNASVDPRAGGRRTEPVRRPAATDDGAVAPAAGASVLVAVDGSAEADQAVRDACRLVHGSAGRLLLATVVDADSLERHGEETATEEAREFLRSRADWIPEGSASVDVHVTAGPAGPALLDLARSERVDLVVIGRHRGGLARTGLGSVVEKLVRSAPCAVLLAAPPPAAARSE